MKSYEEAVIEAAAMVYDEICDHQTQLAGTPYKDVSSIVAFIYDFPYHIAMNDIRGQVNHMFQAKAESAGH